MSNLAEQSNLQPVILSQAYPGSIMKLPHFADEYEQLPEQVVGYTEKSLT